MKAWDDAIEQGLLELAAKAEGRTDYKYVPRAMRERLRHERGLYIWDPFSDDGDAFRLAVKLGMHIHIEEHGSAARIGDQKWRLAPCEDDLYAAARRAIVLAAAEEGKVRTTT